MAYKILENNAVDNTNIEGAAFNKFVAGKKSGIIEFANNCSLSATGNVLIISNGILLIGGVRVRITEPESFTISSAPVIDTRYQVIAQLINTDGENFDFSLFIQDILPLVQNDIVADAGVYQLELGRFTHTTTGEIDDVIRTADILTAGSSGGADFEIGEVTTETLAEGLDAEVDIEKRQVDNKTFIDFSFGIPEGMPEAPIDDSVYGRKNGDWLAVVGADKVVQSQSTAVDTVPCSALLRNSSFACVYRALPDIGMGNDSTQVDIINAMSNNSVMLADFSNNVYKPSGLTLCTIFAMKTSENRNTLCVYDKYTGQLYLGAVGTVGGVQSFSGWKKTLVDTAISTVMPLSSAAASNEKVLGEKVVYDEFAKRTIAQEYKSILSISGITTSNTLFEIFDAMVYPSRLICYPNFEGFNALLPSEAPNIYGAMTIDKQDDYRGKVEYFGHDLTASHLPFLFFGSFNKNQDSPFTGWTQLAPTNNPTFTGTVTVPAPTNPTDAARLQDVTGLSAVYDIVIKTQAQFNAMIASPTWFDAVSVAFVGQFTLSTPDNSGVKRPANVTRIDGYNNAKITVTNFAYNSTTAKGGLWDDENTNNPRCYITDLTVDCTGTGTGYGFSGDNNTYTNCTGTGIGTDNGNGFYGNNNTYTNCTGTGIGTDNGNGFYGNNNTYTNCTGTGTSTGTGYGSYGYGFIGNNNRIISCTALAYLSTDSTPSDTNCVPIYNSSTSANLFMIIRDCKFPEIAKTGYQQGTIWCNIANNTTMVGSIKDNVYHSRFTVAPIKGVNVVADNNSAVDITAI